MAQLVTYSLQLTTAERAKLEFASKGKPADLLRAYIATLPSGDDGARYVAWRFVLDAQYYVAALTGDRRDYYAYTTRRDEALRMTAEQVADFKCAMWRVGAGGYAELAA